MTRLTKETTKERMEVAAVPVGDSVGKTFLLTKFALIYPDRMCRIYNNNLIFNLNVFVQKH